MMAVTSLKHWIHFRLSSRCPPTSNMWNLTRSTRNFVSNIPKLKRKLYFHSEVFLGVDYLISLPFLRIFNGKETLSVAHKITFCLLKNIDTNETYATWPARSARNFVSNIPKLRRNYYYHLEVFSVFYFPPLSAHI